MCAGRWVALVSCTGVQKKTHPNRHHVYQLRVEWSDGTKQTICRSYTAFFDFRNQLKDQTKKRLDCKLPELPSLKWFERGLLANDSVMESKQVLIGEFCQQVLKLPLDLSRGPSVGSFFSPWSSDLPEAEANSKFYLNKHGKAGLKISEPTVIALPQGHAMVESAFTNAADSMSLDVKNSSNSPHLLSNRGGSYKDPPSRKAPAIKASKWASEGDAYDADVEQLYLSQADYKARHSGEVTLRAGNVVDVIQKDLSGWWFVLVEETQEEGWAPGAYLEPVSDRRLSMTEDQPTTESLEFFKTIVDCAGNGKDEISYKAGQEVELLEANMDGWWLIKCNGLVGYTPATNLQQVTDVPAQMRAPSKSGVRNLYHHHSIYKKSTPPPRRSTIGKSVSSLYGKVDFEKKHKNKKKLGKATALEESEDDDDDDDDDSMDSEIPMEPRRQDSLPPPRPLCRKQTIQYTEIEFPPDERGENRPIIRASSPVLYSEIIPGANGKLELKAEKRDPLDMPVPRAKSDCYINVPSSPLRRSYENVSNLHEKKENEFFYVLTEYSSNTAHSQGLDVEKGDIVMAEESSGGRAFCVLCPKSHQPRMRQIEGFLPTDILKPFKPEIVDWSGAVPVVKEPVIPASPSPSTDSVNSDIGRQFLPDEPKTEVLSLPEAVQVTKPTEELSDQMEAICSFKSNNASVASFEKGDKATKIKESESGWLCIRLHQKLVWVPAEYWSPVQLSPEPQPSVSIVRRSSSTKVGPWFVGRMSRGDSEDLFVEKGRQLDFIVRESTNRVGEFTLSVLFDGKVKHFPIDITQDGKYYIGKHGFKDLTKVVLYYQKHPLFFDDNNKPVSLGQPLCKRDTEC